MRRNKKSHFEPHAIKGYFFGKNFRDLGATIVASFQEAWKDVTLTWQGIGDAWEDDGWFFALGITIINFIIIICRLVFGYIFTTFFSIFHVIAITLISFFVYVVYVIVALIDKIYRKIHKLGHACPTCQRKYELPIYICPKCGAFHYHLHPSSYGVFHHRCECGHKLPTLLINGRSRIQRSLCPYDDCHAPALPGVYHPVIFPVIGARSSGKTMFINSSLDLIEQRARSLKCYYKFIDDNVNGDRERFRQELAQGNLLPSTSDEKLVFYNFFFSPKRRKNRNLVSVCDISGEQFASRNLVSRQKGYKYSDSFIFIVDPLAIPAFKDEFIENGFDINDYSASTEVVDDIFANITIATNKIKGRQRKKMQLLVVLTKADIPLVDEYVSKEKIKAYQKAHNVSYWKARDLLVISFLEKYEMHNLINLMNREFNEIHYFVVSSTGHDHKEGTPFIPYGVEEPLLWAIDKAYLNINFDKKIWRKK